MKILPVIILFSLLLFCTHTFGQKKSYFISCHKYGKVFTKCQNPPTFGNGISDLQKYLSDKLLTQISKTTGQIKISIFIDKAGKTCCEWIENNSTFDLKKDQLNLIIDAMPNWNSGIQNGKKVDCLKLISLAFSENKLLVESIEYKTVKRV